MAKRGRPAKAVASAVADAEAPAQVSSASLPGPARRVRATGNGAGRRAKPDFHRQTVLFQWALSKLGVQDLKQLKERFQVSPDSAEGIDERTGLHRFFEAIAGALPTVVNADVVPVDRLRVYEQNILEHTQAINTSRVRHNQPRIDWKYHQYLALLFTEMFLHRYFQDAGSLRDEINAQIVEHNAEASEPDQVAPFSTEAREGDDADPKRQLARLAFWCATGSGKTLLMHVHVRQFRQYHAAAFSAGTWPKLDQIILVTPNDGLSAQHATEFTQSGFDVVSVGEQGVDGLFAEHAQRSIKILSIHKFQDDHGKATVATEAFEGCNLVLVDEGHRGAGRGEDGKWMGRRDQLAKDGFCIEYSATFKEAIGTDEGMKNRYARSVLFDYAYRSFYRDGYGKDFTILNLEEDEKQKRYLTAALLLFYQQLRVWMDGGDAMKPFQVDKPLWVFVGHTVTGGKVSNADDKESVSDVVEVLLFLKRFLAEPTESLSIIQSLLDEGFKDQKGRDLLAHRLPHLDVSGDKAAQARILHEGILQDVFHAPGGGVLAVQLLKGAAGELALKVGEADPFGVVNVGDPAAVADACAERGIARLEDDANRGSLFSGINRDDSPVNLLVGSRKFTEGWNSWRVSSIGLMRMGKSEGTQIIQLFGRGVRLRGYRMSLRRSSVLADKPPTPRNLRQVETLQVFGVKASYMNQFRDWIFSEVPEAQEKQVWDLPVVKTLPSRKLKTLQLREEIEGETVERGQAFRKLGPIVRLRPPSDAPEDAWLRQHRTKLNWLPRVRGIASANDVISAAIGQAVELPRQSLKAIPAVLLDIDALLFGLEAFKASRGLDRLHVDREAIRSLLARDDWYELLANSEDMRITRYENRAQWQRMAQQLLNAYSERFYRFVRGRWEAPYLEVTELSEDDVNIIHGYSVESTELAHTAGQIEQIAHFVDDLRLALERNVLASWSQLGGRWKTTPFAGHLYQPLLHVGKNAEIRISPVALDKWEAQFVEDLASWCKVNKGHEVYLLRNQAVSGLGFFQAANFFPDFLMWVHVDEQQHLVFVDPKGLHHFELSDPKIQFATREVPRLQSIVSEQDRNLFLHAFILSNTPFGSVGWSDANGRALSKEELERFSILFQVDDASTYIAALFHKIFGQSARDLA